MPVDTLLQLAERMMANQLQKADGLSFEALLLYLDVLLARGAVDAAGALLEGKYSAAVQIPHELLRLKVCSHHCRCSRGLDAACFTSAATGHELCVCVRCYARNCAGSLQRTRGLSRLR